MDIINTGCVCGESPITLQEEDVRFIPFLLSYFDQLAIRHQGVAVFHTKGQEHKMKIVPAILADTLEDCRRMLKQAESFTDYVQIDLMDGVFVPSRSFSADQVNSIESSVFFEIHLMVKNPSALMKKISHPHLRQVIFHFESDVNHLEFIRDMKERGIDAGLAINPGTSLGEFRAAAGHVNKLLFLTVDPGYYGSPFREDVLDKIEETRRLFPDWLIEVDGGVSLDNLSRFIDLGVDAVCVGSRIFLKGEPGENYTRFVATVKELEVQKGQISPGRCAD